jgi:dihydrodipicolinate synthase/N-acetylneuraminate lyase
LSPKASGLDSFHENILKLYENKEIIAIKEAQKDQKKVEGNHEVKRKSDVQICCKM